MTSPEAQVEDYDFYCDPDTFVLEGSRTLLRFKDLSFLFQRTCGSVSMVF